MEDGQDSSGSVDEVTWETDTELYRFALEGADLEYNELTGERLIWTRDLESLKKFVESCLQQQGKWTSPGGNTKQFKSGNNNRFQILENTLETTTDKSNAEDGDRDDNPTCLTIIAGDSILKH